MKVLDCLKESVKLLEKAAKEIDTIDNITDLDVLEPRIQKTVFNLQMQANQVAGELVPRIRAKRTELQNGSAREMLANIRVLKEELSKKVKEKEDVNNDNGTISNIADSRSTELENKLPAPGQPGHTGEEHMDQSGKDGDPDPTDEEQVPVQDLPQKETEVREKDDGDGNRQLESNAGDRKSKSSKKAK